MTRGAAWEQKVRSTRSRMGRRCRLSAKVTALLRKLVFIIVERIFQCAPGAEPEVPQTGRPEVCRTLTGAVGASASEREGEIKGGVRRQCCASCRDCRRGSAQLELRPCHPTMSY